MMRTAVAALALGALAALPSAQGQVDHHYRDYAKLLDSSVRGASVDYRALQAAHERLDLVVDAFAAVPGAAEQQWARAQRMAFWINAYNVFTLKAIVDRYPIRGRRFSLHPRNSIRQIDGVWTKLTFRAAGRRITLDDIEHRTLRPQFRDARIHFAINCASVSCPPLREEPYVADRLDAQLDDAARRYLASPPGLQVDGSTLRVSSIFDWYGDDFIPKFVGLVTGDRREKERAILGAIAQFGPLEAQRVARRSDVRVRFLPYDWSLNDVDH